MHINLADGNMVELSSDSTGLDLIKKIKKSLTNDVVALNINGAQNDLATPLHDGDQVQLLTFDDPEGKKIFWHSSAHILAHAVLRLYPNAQPTIGPAIESGFYYDFANLPILENDLLKIEAEIEKILREGIAPQRIEYESHEQAKQAFQHNPFKLEMIEQLEEGLSAYIQNDFIDLCCGPHLPNLSQVQAFKLTKISGAYWRGNSANPQLTRIYGISFPDKKMLKNYLNLLEEARKRDHRVLGNKLDLFSFQLEGPGMPFIHPKGMIIWKELMRFWDEMHDREGYDHIKTPVMMSHELWETSGHWENYRENMYVSELDDKTYVIKPMNCPGAMLYFKEHNYSYRQLPLRVAEVGLVHRHELSGSLSGLFRVRCFHQDDAHIFMKSEDIVSEIEHVLRLAFLMYQTFGLDYHLELSTRPSKSIGTDAQWELATNGLKQSLDRSGYKYKINEGDGAFYGPKIDIHIKDALGRTWQCGTIQLDMNLPERFALAYTDSNGEKQRPIMVHRVIYGSIERFFGVLIEHYAGKFPMWLSPVQIKILPITDSHQHYACDVLRQFKNAGLRAEVDLSNESINKKVRNAQQVYANYIIVVGDREMMDHTVTVRAANTVIGSYPIELVVAQLKEEYLTRSPRRNTVVNYTEQVDYA